MSGALMERPSATPAMPAEQVELIRRTVAQGATNDELALFLYDCQRRGIHPLEKLLHFTKRGGKYTPVTSIDFMRSQAAMTGEMAGSDDPLFSDGDGVWSSLPKAAQPMAAMVTVYRLTQGQRFAYSATARWSEYCPDNAPMWKRMPHTMLGKCAEALALRKAFPQQLAGLYSREEMDQAGSNGYTVEAPPSSSPIRTPALQAGDSGSNPDSGTNAASSNGKTSGFGPENVGSTPAAVAIDNWSQTPQPAGCALVRDPNLLYIERVETRPTKNANVTKGVIHLSTGEEVTTIKSQLIALCQQICQENAAVSVETKQSKWGIDLITAHRVQVAQPVEDVHSQPVTSDEIPF